MRYDYDRAPVMLDLFSGLGGASQGFKAIGWDVCTLDVEPKFNPDICASILDVTADDLRDCGPFDFIWASPPCQAFSMASLSHHWIKPYPDKQIYWPRPGGKGSLGIAMVERALLICHELAPQCGWLMENPKGMLRLMPVVQHLERRTITYCQYALPCPECFQPTEQPGLRCNADHFPRQKPTDIWSDHWPPALELKPPCKRNTKTHTATCHVAAARGAKTGTQGLKGAPDRSMVAYGLSLDVAKAADDYWVIRSVGGAA